MPLYIRQIAPLLTKFMNISKASQGAESLLHGALNPDVQAGDFIGHTGDDERTVPPDKVVLALKALDKSLREKLWSLPEELLGNSFQIERQVAL